MDKLRVIDLFSGIGGFSLGLDRAGGFRTVAFVEKDAYCRRVLRKHWPDVPIFEDVRDANAETLPPAEVVTGGFPCQPFSTAGQQRGADDDRNLWPEMRRIVGETRPRWVIGENVAGLFGVYLDTVLADLEAEGYEAWTVDIPAVAFDAPHIRHRLWIVAHADGYGQSQPGRVVGQIRRRAGDGGQETAVAETLAHAHSERFEKRDSAAEPDQTRQHSGRVAEIRGGFRWPSESGISRVVDGVPPGLDEIGSIGDALEALSNAVVPAAVTHIGRALLAIEGWGAA